MRRKAVFFTLISILIIELVVTAYIISLDIDYKRGVSTVENRVRLANLYNQRVRELFVGTIVKAAAYNNMSHFAASRYYLYSDVGSLGADFSSQLLRHVNSSLAELSAALNRTFHLEFSFVPKGAALFQSEITGPWFFGVNLSLDYYLKADLASWNISNVSVVAMVPITGLPDPYYLRHTGADFAVPIKRFENENAPWNLSLMLYYLNGTVFRHEPKAPSFLMRMVNDNSGSECCGIESIVNPAFIDADRMGAVRQWNDSYIDYCYFGRACRNNDYDLYLKVYRIPGLPAGLEKLKLDMYHIKLFNLTIPDDATAYCQFDAREPLYAAPHGSGCESG